eukprot:358445-Chlamydomonas_euryale.AAC.29
MSVALMASTLCPVLPPPPLPSPSLPGPSIPTGFPPPNANPRAPALSPPAVCGHSRKAAIPTPTTLHSKVLPDSPPSLPSGSPPYHDPEAILLALLQEFDESKGSLIRMLADFENDRQAKHNMDVASSAAPRANGAEVAPLLVGPPLPDSVDKELESGMKLVMASYEQELRRPLRNLILGDLARAMLIQVGFALPGRSREESHVAVRPPC